MTPPHPIARDGESERYTFTNGWTMRREGVRPYFWVLFDGKGHQVDWDQYRHDMMPRHKLTVLEHFDPFQPKGRG